MTEFKNKYQNEINPNRNDSNKNKSVDFTFQLYKDKVCNKETFINNKNALITSMQTGNPSFYYNFQVLITNLLMMFLKSIHIYNAKIRSKSNYILKYGGNFNDTLYLVCSLIHKKNIYYRIDELNLNIIGNKKKHAEIHETIKYDEKIANEAIGLYNRLIEGLAALSPLCIVTKDCKIKFINIINRIDSKTSNESIHMKNKSYPQSEGCKIALETLKISKIRNSTDPRMKNLKIMLREKYKNYPEMDMRSILIRYNIAPIEGESTLDAFVACMIFAMRDDELDSLLKNTVLTKKSSSNEPFVLLKDEAIENVKKHYKNIMIKVKKTLGFLEKIRYEKEMKVLLKSAIKSIKETKSKNELETKLEYFKEKMLELG